MEKLDWAVFGINISLICVCGWWVWAVSDALIGVYQATH